MKEYRLTLDSYYGLPLGTGVPFSGFGDNLKLCKPTIGELVARYGVARKDILSLGAGAAFEEFWFADAGCRLTLVDNDQSFDTYLAMRPQATDADASAPTLTYIIGDAGQYVESRPDPEFDVLYVSSFHPDEIRRETIQQTFVETRTCEEARHYISWPAGTAPYHDLIVQAFKKVRDGGLIILQHYRGGPYIDHNAHYIDDMESQFRDHGVTLLEVHCFRRSPGHLLVTACRGSGDVAEGIMRQLAHRPPITMFHGRYDYANIKMDVIRVFERGKMSGLFSEFLSFAKRHRVILLLPIAFLFFALIGLILGTHGAFLTLRYGF